MKKGKVILILLLAVLIAASFFAYANRQYIKILHKGVTMSSEDIEAERAKTDEHTKEVAKEYGIENIRELTEEEAQKVANGDISEDEAIDLILASAPDTQISPQKTETASQKNTAPNPPISSSSPKAEENSAAQNSSKEKISRLVAKMYVLKSQFSSRLADIEQWAELTYVNLSDEEIKTKSAKWKIASEALEMAAELEKKCDAEVEQVLSELTSALEETNQSTKLVDEIRNSYKNEKELAKSYYISKFQE